MKSSPFEDGVRLPNLEDAADPVKYWGQHVFPVGFGFILPGWEPRVSLAGTYDKGWQSTRMPRFPLDFDSHFFNAASTGLISEGYLRGGESVRIENATADGLLEFRIPQCEAPVCEVSTPGRTKHEVRPCLDTVIIDTDAMHIIVIWRGYLRTPRGLHDVQAVEVRI